MHAGADSHDLSCTLYLSEFDCQTNLSHSLLSGTRECYCNFRTVFKKEKSLPIFAFCKAKAQKFIPVKFKLRWISADMYGARYVYLRVRIVSLKLKSFAT